MLAENNEPQINFDSIQPASDSRSRSQLLLALALLITALILVIMKNRQFWFDVLNLEELANQTTSETMSNSQPRVNPTPTRKANAKQSVSSSAATSTEVLPEPHETVLSPLQVDVTYSSGQRRTIVASNSAIHLDLQQGPQPSSAASNPSATGVRVRFSGQAFEILGRPVEPVYPLPAQLANVQGSVVLQASIGEDGNVRALQVISGPAMLTSAAMEAVKQWHFKPHYQEGKAVPAETRITVNFTISAQ